MRAEARNVSFDGRLSEAASAIARGTRRLLRLRGIATITELVLADGRRADIVGLAPDGSIVIVEVKSSIGDFRSDQKWHNYRNFCDRLYFAIASSFPAAIMPAETGLIVADAYGAEILRESEEHRLAGPTRRAMLIRFAQAAADRLHALGDPDGPS